jgi:hypothetical protein
VVIRTADDRVIEERTNPRASFPTDFVPASTPAIQVAYYDRNFMHLRMDYSPDVTGKPPVAHYTHDPKTFDGIVFPTRRLVHLHDAAGVANRVLRRSPSTSPR